MTKDKWDTLTTDQRIKAVLEHDTSGMMALPEWRPLLTDMARPYDQLTRLQQGVVEEIK